MNTFIKSVYKANLSVKILVGYNFRHLPNISPLLTDEVTKYKLDFFIHFYFICTVHNTQKQR